jgi:thioredoxin 2
MMAVITCPTCGAKNRVDEGRAASLQAVCGRCGTKLDAPAAGGGKPVAVTDATFADVVGDARPVLVDCWAPWCGPCRMIAPMLDQLAAESGGKYLVAKLNVDENPRTARHFMIESIPTLLLFKGGNLVERIVGLQPKQAIAQRLQAQI